MLPRLPVLERVCTARASIDIARAYDASTVGITGRVEAETLRPARPSPPQ